VIASGEILPPNCGVIVKSNLSNVFHKWEVLSNIGTVSWLAILGSHF
jgi:hypothetical protein